MRTSVLLSVLTTALVVGIAACKGPDDISNTYTYKVVARGANTIPQAADTTPTITASLDSGASITFASLVKTGGPTIDSIKIFSTGASTDLTPATGTAPVAVALVCAPCAGASGTVTLRGTATVGSVVTAMKGYNAQFVAFSGTTGGADGFARGTIYPEAQ